MGTVIIERMEIHRGTVVALALLLAGGCIPTMRPTPAPLPSELYRVGAGEPSCLVVMLHGRGGSMHDFRDAGFIDTLDAFGIEAEVVTVGAHFGYYAKRTLLTRLQEDIIAPARERGLTRIWLVGVSMGGFGSLMYSSQHPDEISGVVLFSPYLGDEELIEEIESAGGLEAWSPGGEVSLEEDYQRALWSWLKRNLASSDGIPLYLGFGAAEKFVASNTVLAEAMPSGTVLVGEGGHTWTTWSPLWKEFVNAGVPCDQ
jgi:pimeloyl-ACP methyl ester carboxylesterase